MRSIVYLLAGVTAFAALAASGPQPPKQAAKPPPDLAQASYGPHARNVLDLWKAPSTEPTPLVVFIHGGGFRGGSKENLSPALLAACLKAGISVMAVNYRLSPEVHFPAHYEDCARAIQFARHHAREWNLDPRRVAATGGSAGACTSLWIGFHDDLADAKSPDPVRRQSTRLSSMAVLGAQTTLDPDEIARLISPITARHPAFEGFYGISWSEKDTPRARKLFADASPITHLTGDDPPVYAFYNEPRGPVPADARPGTGIHHIRFGTFLKERMDKLGIECVVRHQDEGGDTTAEMVAFFRKHFGLAAEVKPAKP